MFRSSSLPCWDIPDTASSTRIIRKSRSLASYLVVRGQLEKLQPQTTKVLEKLRGDPAAEQIGLVEANGRREPSLG